MLLPPYTDYSYTNEAYVYEGQLKPSVKTASANTSHHDDDTIITAPPPTPTRESHPSPTDRNPSTQQREVPRSVISEMNRSPTRGESSRHMDTSTTVPQPMYESLDSPRRSAPGVATISGSYNHEDDPQLPVSTSYRHEELPLPMSVDPDINHSPQWPPPPELTRTRHNLVEIAFDDDSSSDGASSVVDVDVENEGMHYPPPPVNFL